MADNFDFKIVKLQIPSLTSKIDKPQAMAYVYAVDKLIRGARSAKERTKICIIAKAKLEGAFREAIIGSPDDWAQVRRIIVATSANRKSIQSLVAALDAVKQGSLALEEYYNKVKGILIDLILARTANVNEAQALAIENDLRDTEKNQFIDGLSTAWSNFVANKDPNSLDEAYDLATEREAKMETNDPIKELSFTIKQLVGSNKKNVTTVEAQIISQ